MSVNRTVSFFLLIIITNLVSCSSLQTPKVKHNLAETTFFGALFTDISPGEKTFHDEQGNFHQQLIVPSPQGAVLYLHGLGDNSSAFKKSVVLLNNHKYQLDSLTDVMDQLLPNYDHLLPDFPGYGRSYQPNINSNLPNNHPAALNLNELADYAARVIIQYQTSRKTQKAVVVVGHSMSGIVGLILAEKHPKLVKAFINIEGNIGVNDLFLSGLHAQYTFSEFKSRKWYENKDKVEKISDVTVYAYAKRSDNVFAKQLWLNSAQLVAASYTDPSAQKLSVSTKKSIKRMGLTPLSLKAQPAQRTAALTVPNYLLLGSVGGGAHKYNLQLLSNAGLSKNDENNANDYCLVKGNHWLWQLNQVETQVCIKRFLNELKTSS